MVCIALGLPAANAATVPFWGAQQSMPADTPVAILKRGEFIWLGDAVDSGPLLIVVSLSEQRAYVYRNGVLIGATTVSTGRPGHETPTGVFSILQKDKDHRSTIYDGAPMPFMERLTWGGVALHAGGLPGYPESHGCVHLPSEFARLLYKVTTTGMTVVIGDEHNAPSSVVHPGLLSPVDAQGRALPLSPLLPGEEERWQPELSTSGPLSIVLSRQSGRALVFRNGVEIGRSRATFRGDAPLGTHVLILEEGAGQGPARLVPDASRWHWLLLSTPGHAQEAGTEPSLAASSRVEIPSDFLQKVFSELYAGATVVVTDAPLSASTSGATLDVINADPQSAGN